MGMAHKAAPSPSGMQPSKARKRAKGKQAMPKKTKNNPAGGNYSAKKAPKKAAY